MREEERTARVELAACYRLLAHFGVSDLTYNHLSARVPGEPERLLIKPRTMMFEEVTASSLEKFGFDDPGLRGGGKVIHAGVLAARPDLHAVFHTHTPANMGVASQAHGLLMINQHAVSFYNRIAYHDFGGFEFDPAMRAPLVRDLADKRVALLRNHGALVCGRSIAEAFVTNHFLEMACKGQIAALAGGAKVTLIPEEVCERGARQFAETDPVSKDWDACLRLARRLDPGFES
jgi:ribulose-5-phosphate 4-epimerase/fuculose-1-phosphate aldolase